MHEVITTLINRRVQAELSTGTQLMGTIYSVSPSGSMFTISDCGEAYVEFVSVAHVVRVKIT